MFFASNGFAVKRIYISVFSGRGRAPKVRETGDARSFRWASGAAQRFSIKKVSDLVGKFPCGLRLRASLFVRLRALMFPDGRGTFWDCGQETGGICGSSRP